MEEEKKEQSNVEQNNIASSYQVEHNYSFVETCDHSSLDGYKDYYSTLNGIDTYYSTLNGIAK